jgi:hypothetical protein
MNRPVRGPVLLVVLAAALASAGCLQKAKPAQPAGFIPPENLEKPTDLPFQKAWRSLPNWDRYTEIYIAPFNTDHLREMTWWEKLERGEKVKQDAEELALYAQTTFREAFANDPKHRFRVVDLPGPNSLMAEIALTEVVPNKIVLDALGYAAGPAVGAAGTAAANVQTVTTHSTVAFEARMRDGASKEIVAMFADREQEKYFPVNLKDLTWYGHAKSIIKEWANQFVKIANQQPGEIIKDSPLFDLKPW